MQITLCEEMLLHTHTLCAENQELTFSFHVMLMVFKLSVALYTLVFCLKHSVVMKFIMYVLFKVLL